MFQESAGIRECAYIPYTCKSVCLSHSLSPSLPLSTILLLLNFLLLAYSVITDLACTLLPIVVVWKVNIVFKLKLAICGLMSLGLIATACAVVRGVSLGLVTTDLSWEYCTAAIWGNTELHLGITATNLSLSRSIYAYFAGENPPSLGVQQRTPYSSKPRDRRSGQGWTNVTNINSASKNAVLETAISGRRGSEAVSVESDIHLGAIKKTTEFHIASETSQSDKSVAQKSWDRSGPQLEDTGDTTYCWGVWIYLIRHTALGGRNFVPKVWILQTWWFSVGVVGKLHVPWQFIL